MQNWVFKIVAIISVATWSATADLIVHLSKEDFAQGTLIIDKPGQYILTEDVQFRPQGELLESSPETWMFPDRSQPPYDASQFRLGFFCAIAIVANGVELDLGGFTISQSPEHHLIQRFFAVIELANSPFGVTQGPADFVRDGAFVTSQNLVIKNGRIGRSSHHGIHGNNNNNVTLRNLEIFDFEVAGISLNRQTNLNIENVRVHHSLMDVPANGRLSASIFLLQAVLSRLLIDTTFDGGKSGIAIFTARDKLRKSLYRFLSSSEYRSTASSPFSSATDHLPDGSMLAGVVLNSDLNVGGFLQIAPTNFATNFRIFNLTVHDLASKPTEVGTFSKIRLEESGETGYNTTDVSHDITGAVFDVDYCTKFENNTWHYLPNEFTDLQLAVAEYAHACLAPGSNCTEAELPSNRALLMRNTIFPAVVSWSRGLETWETLLQNYTIVGNHDIMHHQVKGLIGLKLDGLAKVSADLVKVFRVKNRSDGRQRSKHLLSDPVARFSGFDARAVSVATSVDVDMKRIGINNLESEVGPSMCVDALFDFRNVSFSSMVQGMNENNDFVFPSGTADQPPMLGVKQDSPNNYIWITAVAVLGSLVLVLLLALLSLKLSRNSSSNVMALKKEASLPDVNSSNCDQVSQF